MEIQNNENSSSQKEEASFYDALKSQINRLVNVTIVDVKDDKVTVNVGKYTKDIPLSSFIKGEPLSANSKMKMCIEDKSEGDNHKLILTRNNAKFVSLLFEDEVREMFSGLISIKNIVRDPGVRCKIILASKDDKYNPCAICIGKGGTHVKAIRDHLGFERIDFIKYTDDPALLIKEAVKPGEAIAVNIEESLDGKKEAICILTDDSIFAAIGKKGSNLKLAEKLTGYNLRAIKESEAAAKNLKYTKFKQ